MFGFIPNIVPLSVDFPGVDVDEWFDDDDDVGEWG